MLSEWVRGRCRVQVIQPEEDLFGIQMHRRSWIEEAWKLDFGRRKVEEVDDGGVGSSVRFSVTLVCL